MSKAVGRIAFRAEGAMWNAYFAASGTMEGATLLGSLRMDIARDPVRKLQFQTLMTEVIADLCEAAFDERPDMNIQAAPESERSGNA